MTQPLIPKSSQWEKTPFNALAITPLDGRNFHKISALSEYFSETALNRQRLTIELKYLLFLSKLGVAPKIPLSKQSTLQKLVSNFTAASQNRIRRYETQTNHDVKAVEYYLSAICRQNGLKSLVPFIHWGLTSEDVNNLAYQINLKAFHCDCLLPLLTKYFSALKTLADRCHLPMLGRTHGQPAQVTTLAKELTVYLNRLHSQIKVLTNQTFEGKISGAVGSYTDHTFAAPGFNWPAKLSGFVSSLGLKPVTLTIQILPYDHLVTYFHRLHLLQTISLDLAKNLWQYVSLGYLDQTNSHFEVGSSVMPQKINPIYLEGAEGGFEISNALFQMYQRKLPQSRLQRDLSDSTIRRGFGVAFAYSYLSFQSLVEALARLRPNPQALKTDLESHYEVLTSSVQTYLRAQQIPRAYELLFKKVRGVQLSQAAFQDLIKSLGLTSTQTQTLLSLSFSGLTSPLTKLVKQNLKSLSL